MESENIAKYLKESVQFIKRITNLKPSIGIILGSGLGGFADSLEEKVKIPASDIPYYPQSTVSGHKGYLVFGQLEKIPILAVQGRTHFYEGHNINDVAYVVRIMAKIGIQILIVTNAAGSVNPKLRPGDLMIIVDHINFMFQNSLQGKPVNNEPRWVDMYDAYHQKYIKIIEQIGTDLNLQLKKGILFASTGPTYETKSEVKMAHKFGADTVGMSTVPEVLVARANGIKVAGITCITNMATGISSTPLSHKDVTEIASKVRNKFQHLLSEVVVRLNQESKKRPVEKPVF